MSERIRFHLDGAEVDARPGETIWQVAKRHGTRIPHLCHRDEPGYRPDGNCRACMVEVEGERVLAASCIRRPTPGMKVKTASERAVKARRFVLELLVTDQPEREVARDPDSAFWGWADTVGVSESRFPRDLGPTGQAHDEAMPGQGHRSQLRQTDITHPAISVHLDACIHCNLCVRACREVQVNDVIGMAYRGHLEKVVFDFDDPMGMSTCVSCGECVQACPTGALMPASLMGAAGTKAITPEREVDSVCPYCGVGCQLTFKLAKDRDDEERIVAVDGIEGPANLNRLCVKGRYGFDYVHSPERLTRPLVRIPGAPKTTDIDPANPWTHFREASWAEALDLAAGGLRRIRDLHGGNALAGFGSAKGSNEEAYLFQKLVRTGFGTNNVDHCTRLCHASSVAALMEGIGSAAVTAPFTAVADAEVIVVIGANPTENHPVAATFFKQAAKRGAKLIVMDPRGQALRRHASHMLQFKPGTDVAMLNGILHVIVTEGLWDKQYVAAHVQDFERIAESVRHTTPEAMEGICGIPAGVLRQVARLFAKSRASIIFWGMGVSQHTHGTDNARLLIALSLITGQVGRPGTGLHPLRGQNNVQGASDAGLIPMVLPDYRPLGDDEARGEFERLWGATLDPKPGLTVVEIVDAAYEGRIKGMYVMGENPAMSDPDAAHAREAMARLEHMVVQDIFLTETACLADVVLPASAWPEKWGTVTNTNRQVQIGRPALTPPGEARQDLELIVEIARRLGLPWDYEHARDVFAEMAQAMPSLRNITWERLEREGSVTYPCDAPDKPGHDIVFGNGFPTASGRARLVPAEWRPPAEVPDADYPMVLTTGRQLEHWHTGAMTRRATVLDAIEPSAVACLAPADMNQMDIAPGEPVRVSTRRGVVELPSRIDPAVPPGMVFIPFWDPAAAANLLTNPQLDPFGKIPEYKFCAAKVEKVPA